MSKIPVAIQVQPFVFAVTQVPNLPYPRMRVGCSGNVSLTIGVEGERKPITFANVQRHLPRA